MNVSLADPRNPPVSKQWRRVVGHPDRGPRNRTGCLPHSTLPELTIFPMIFPHFMSPVYFWVLPANGHHANCRPLIKTDLCHINWERLC